MIKHLLKITIRNFLKNKVFVLLNIIGMGLAIACCIVAYLNFDYNMSFDQQHEKLKNIYRVNHRQEIDGKVRTLGEVPLPIIDQIRQYESLDVVRYNKRRGSVSVNDHLFDCRMGFVDKNFFEIFTFPLIQGESQSIFLGRGIIISEKLAMITFGSLDVIGKDVQFLDRGSELSFIISGVFEKIPNNSSLDFDAIISFDYLLSFYQTKETDWTSYSTAFLYIQDTENIPEIESSINKIASSVNQLFPQNKPISLYLDPMDGMAIRSVKANIEGSMREPFPWPVIFFPFVLSFIILLIAGFTFTNTFIAFSGSRLKEIALRKVSGAKRYQIVGQFLGEAIIISLLSLVLAIPLADLILSEFNQLVPKIRLDIGFSNDGAFFIFLIGLVVFAGITAGSYSAFYISSFKPANILSGSYSYGEISVFSKLMLASQLGLSMFAITSCVIFIQNANYQQNIDLGFDLDETVVVRFTGGEEEYWPLYNHLMQNPRIHKITAAADHVGRRYYTEVVTFEDQKINVAGMDIGDEYFQTMEIDVISGRTFSPGSESDHEQSVMINRNFVQHMGWENPVGKRLVLHDTSDYYVIGVVEDFYFNSYGSEIQPMWFRYARPDEFVYLIVKTDAALVASVMEEVHLAWRTVFNNTENDIKTGQHARYEGEVVNGMIIKILIFIGFTATLLSLVGLYALVSLNIVSRYKEIGIRKVLGGGVRDIIVQINRPFILVFSISILVGATLSYVFIPMLLDAMWAYHIGANVWVFICALFIMILTTLITVGTKARRAAMVNPVDLIRN